MGKATGVGSMIFGLIMIFLGIGAYFSGEEASKTDNGRMAIGIVILLGLALIYGGVSARQKEAEKAKQPQQAAQGAHSTEPLPPPPPPDPESAAYCPYCGRGVQADFVVCPFCGKQMKNSCPKCGKQVQNDFVACPYCGTALGGKKA